MFENIRVHMRLIPNQLTKIRFVAVPAMWVCAVLDRPRLIGIGLFVGLVTDMLDGPVARRLGQTTDFGSKFDSLSDQMMQISAIAWVFMMRPEIFSENLLLAVLALSIYLASLLLGLIKFGRLANLHLYLSKASGLLLYLFLIHTFFSPGYDRLIFHLAAAGFILSSAETLALQVIQTEVSENTGSLLFLYIDEDHLLRRLASHLP